MKRVGFRIPNHLWEKIKNIAEYKGYTLNKLFIDACWEFVESYEEKQQDKEKNHEPSKTKTKNEQN